MIRTQVYLDDDVYQQIRLQARLQNQPAASLIRRFLRVGLVREKKQRTLTAGRALLRIAKTAVKGPRDLSRRHDDYLYGDK